MFFLIAEEGFVVWIYHNMFIANGYEDYLPVSVYYE